MEANTKEEINTTVTKKTELNDNLEKMEDVSKQKLKYELELMAWQQDCASLEKTINEERYRIEIEQARMKRQKEAEFKS